MAAAVEHAYRYAAPSALLPARGKARRPTLRLVTSGGRVEAPHFFAGALVEPKTAATLLLTQGLVARSRFHLPPAMLQRLLAMADPVLSADGERLRFESFSACCGVYARTDLEAGALTGEHLGRGTTNVDFNLPLRTALTKIAASGAPLALRVGAEAFEVSAGDEEIVERRVPLPLRWIKGFVEVQAYQARMTRRFTVDGHEARRLVRALPKQATRDAFWLRSAGRGLRLGQARGGDGVRVGAPERLRLLEQLARFATGLTVYADPDGQASAFELAVGDAARFSLLLSADVWRGLSGEGQALSALGREAAGKRGTLARLQAALRWQGVLDPEALAGELGLDGSTIDSGLATLGARGLVGFDLHNSRYFHRELPFDLSLVEKVQPRLAAARELLKVDGAVAIVDEESAAGSDSVLIVAVKSGSVTYRVRFLADSDREAGSARCACPWFAKHGGARGPCKHVLAAQLFCDSDKRGS